MCTAYYIQIVLLRVTSLGMILDFFFLSYVLIIICFVSLYNARNILLMVLPHIMVSYIPDDTTLLDDLI